MLEQRALFMVHSTLRIFFYQKYKQQANSFTHVYVVNIEIGAPHLYTQFDSETLV